MTDSWKITGIISTAVIVLMIPLSLVLHKPSDKIQKEQAKFTGGKECISCHKREYDLWKSSKHDNAMDFATDSTVLGDFNNAEAELNGVKHRFYKRDGKFYVFTKGIGGSMAEFEVAYTFGVKPLQQYLIPFEKGKYQCLPIAWDTERKKWFDMSAMVYRPEELKPHSWFYWTNQSQNWNGMCAECHSTNLNKNYNPADDSYNTTWSDIDVNCESCHGPGSFHLDWAKLGEGSRDFDRNKGLVLKTSGTTSKQYIEACAPCHSRRTSFGPETHSESNYFDKYRPENIIPPLYHADGQIEDEVYEFASFTQSKMYMHDVKCSDCHDSHSLKFKFDGNALCTQCHKAEEFDTYRHHFHKYKNETGSPVTNKHGETVPVGEGALCVNCHMAGKYYMGIDFRRDHSMRVPRPDLSVKYNTPNACNLCHADKNNQWSEDYIKKYFGENRKYTFEIALIEGSLQKAGADTSLIKIIKNNLYPEIVRAAAIHYLTFFAGNPAVPEVIREMLNNPEPVIRERAIDAYTSVNPELTVLNISPLLNDPVKIVRIAAASKLSGLPKEKFTSAQYDLLVKVLDEYLAVLMYTADFPTGKYNLGNFYADRSDYNKAVVFYNDAIRMDSMFYPAKSNLAMLYYNTGSPEKAENLFLNLIKNHPEYTIGYYYIGLLYAEQKRYTEAADALEKGEKVNPSNRQIYYNLGIIYQYLNNTVKAESSLLKAYSISPDEFDVLYALADFYIKKADYQKAMKFAAEIKQKYPSNQDGIKLLNYLDKILKN
jgi:tetratricopeptide (TPR) repeat protein